MRGIHRAPHTSPELGYGMSNQATSDMLNILMGDVPDIARESRVTIDNKVYDVIEVQPDEYHVMASLALMEA